MLNNWRNSLKKVSTDGCGPLPGVDAQFLKGLLSQIQEAQDFQDFLYSATTVLQTIPGIVNDKKRQDAACQFGKEMKSKKFDMGTSLQSRLRALEEGVPVEAIDFNALKELLTTPLLTAAAEAAAG